MPLLEDALEVYDGTILLVSHDRALLDALAARIWSFADAQLQDYPGTFAEWEEQRSRLKRELDALEPALVAALHAWHEAFEALPVS